MSKTAQYWLGHSLAVIAAAALLAGCGDDTPVGPARPTLDLRGCENLQVPAGSPLALHVYARGVQIYRWSGTAWTFVEPSAVLFADAQGKSAIGIHYSGPTWLGVSGSKVVGAVVDRCVPNASAIPWLLLGAVSADGPGVLQGTKFIHRVNTAGGNAPSAPGTVTGEVTSVPYTAEYLFYRGQ